MVDFSSRKSDPDKNALFARDWGAGRFHVRLAGEAARWLKARRNKEVRASLARSQPVRLRHQQRQPGDGSRLGSNRPHCALCRPQAR